MTPYTFDISVRDKEKHKLDISHPHDCFYCGFELRWLEYLDANRFFDGRKISFRGLKKLWKSKVIQFYCCNCYEGFKKVRD